MKRDDRLLLLSKLGDLAVQVGALDPGALDDFARDPGTTDAGRDMAVAFVRCREALGSLGYGNVGQYRAAVEKKLAKV